MVSGAKMTYRYFLQDRFFAAIVELPQKLVPTFAQALIDPVFDIYLGRKCCAPTDIVYRGTYSSEEEAITAALAIGIEKGLIEEFRAVDGEGGDEVMTLNDVPLQFGAVKKYKERRVALIRHE
jgi:CRISPR system Cascade subunit CasD